jgi:alkanesulfonate monooxygenase SsuD/methylene tetrahydromethanopterin reductase-like flavin-dependent oxidoreductase (luciferase family)
MGAEGRVRFGICYNVDYHPDIHGTPADYYAQMLDQCVLLEQLGYHSAWFSEHHSGPYSFGNPALMIAQAATRTTRLKLGTGVSLLPLHHPVTLNEEYAMLDQLTGGRLEYGVGRGYLFHEYPWLGVDVAESSERYRKSLDFILKAWAAEGPMSFHGKFYTVDNYTPFPPVLQKPTPPIYASALSPDSFIFAGSRNLDLGVALFTPFAANIKVDLANYDRALADNGFSRANRSFMGITQMYCAPDDATAVTTGCRYAKNYYDFFCRLLITGAGGPTPASERMAKVDTLALNSRNQTLFGNPQSLVEKIRYMQREWGVDYLQLEVAQGGCKPTEVAQVLRLFGEEVMPHFK